MVRSLKYFFLNKVEHHGEPKRRRISSGKEQIKRNGKNKKTNYKTLQNVYFLKQKELGARLMLGMDVAPNSNNITRSFGAPITPI